MTKPIVKSYHEELINADDENYTFYYKMTDPSQTEMKIVDDPELKALAINRLKQNLDTTLHVALRFYSWVYGPQNFFDLSEQPDKQRILEHMDLVEIEPIHSTLSEEELKRKLREMDGVILPGGMNFPYEPMDSEEFMQYYEPNGKPKTELKHRVDTEIFNVYRTWINEIININSGGQFLPAWNVCLSLYYIPFVLGSSQLNLDYFGRTNYKLKKMRKVKHESLQQQSKKNSLLEMTNTELKDFEDESFYLFANSMGYCVSTLANDPEFISQFDLLYTSSQNNFENPIKEKEDPKKNILDGYFVNPESLDPEFVSMIEHKKFPIYGVQFYSEVMLRYFNVYRHPDIDRIRQANVLFSKFYISMILRNKLASQQNQTQTFAENFENYIESNVKSNSFKYFISTIEDILPDFEKKISKEFGLQEYYREKNQSKLSKGEKIHLTWEDEKLECLSSMAVALKGAGYNNVGLFWK
jgi:GMP synthase-like glutamine amidotransferase